MGNIWPFFYIYFHTDEIPRSAIIFKCGLIVTWKAGDVEANFCHWRCCCLTRSDSDSDAGDGDYDHGVADGVADGDGDGNGDGDGDADIYIMMQCVFVCHEKSSLPLGSFL